MWDAHRQISVRSEVPAMLVPVPDRTKPETLVEQDIADPAITIVCTHPHVPLLRKMGFDQRCERPILMCVAVAYEDPLESPA